MGPEPGIHTIERLVLFRVVDQPLSLSGAVEQIDVYRVTMPARKHYPRYVVIVLPAGAKIDSYAEELLDLSERNIGVVVDGSVVLDDMAAWARRGSTCL